MKEKNKKSPVKNKENLKNNNPNPDDSLKPLEGEDKDQPEIYKINKRGKSIDRKSFIKSASAIAGLAALGSLFDGCKEAEFGIANDGKNCTCHAVCTCNSEDDDDNRAKGDEYNSHYDQNQNCTCDTVCTCNSVCSCDTVCSCDSDCSCNSHSGGGGGTYYYTYWYPN